jgi:hypothetical protein
MAACIALAAMPFMIMAAWVLEERALGTHFVSWACHSVNIDEPLDALYRWVTR